MLKLGETCKHGHLLETSKDIHIRPSTGKRSCAKCKRISHRKAKKSIKRLTQRGAYRILVNSAKRRGFSLLLSFDDFLQIRQSQCDYCGGSLPPLGHGVDRKKTTCKDTQKRIVSLVARNVTRLKARISAMKR